MMATHTPPRSFDASRRHKALSGCRRTHPLFPLTTQPSALSGVCSLPFRITSSVDAARRNSPGVLGDSGQIHLSVVTGAMQAAIVTADKRTEIHRAREEALPTG